MPTSLVHARTSATSLVHAHTFLAVFVGIKLRIWSFGFRVLEVSGFRGGVVMTFVLLEHMACHKQDTFFQGLGGFGFRVLGVSGFAGFRGGVVMTFPLLEHMACHR